MRFFHPSSRGRTPAVASPVLHQGGFVGSGLCRSHGHGTETSLLTPFGWTPRAGGGAGIRAATPANGFFIQQHIMDTYPIFK